LENLVPDVRMFNEYHALIVRHGKQKCTRHAPKCNTCVLNNICTFADSRFQIPDSR
jgi:endonuclease-3 related protein